MKNYKAVAVVLGLTSLGIAPNARADQWNKKTYISVSEPIQVPGKVLQPGKYVMRLVDSPANRHVVQIFNEREDKLQATVLAIPNYRLQPTGKTEFQWWETPAGQPKALRAWFYPGDNFGQEFAYPKNEAVQLASGTSQNVPATYAQTEAELATARVGTVDRAGTELELDRKTYSRSDGTQPNEVAQTRRPQPATEPQTIAQAQPATPAQPAPTQAQPGPSRAISDAGRPVQTETTLPQTASSLPLAGLAGLLALGASVAVRALGNRS